MAQLDRRSDKELEEALAKDELAPKKAAFAKEVLKRRDEARGPRFMWLASALASLAVGIAAFRKIWRKRD